MATKNDELDLIWGVAEIGKLIGRNYSQTYHLIQAGHLPIVQRLGERYVVSRAKLLRFFLGDEHAA